MKYKYNKEEAKHLFFTSDTHFDHANIIRFCKRPWSTAEEMNEALVERWNKKVGPNDIVFHLGDFCFGGSAEWKKWREKLNGHIILIRGNHDRKMSSTMEVLFDEVLYQAQLEIDGRSVYLNHYPFLTYGGCWRKEKSAVWQLFGHCHSKDGIKGADSGRLKYLFPTQYDVGVDNNNYEPVSWEEIKNIMEASKKESVLSVWKKKLAKLILFK